MILKLYKDNTTIHSQQCPRPPPEAKHNRAQPFSFKKKDWPDEGNKLKVKLEGKKGGAKGKKNWKWGQAENKAFFEAKRMLSKEALLLC